MNTNNVNGVNFFNARNSIGLSISTVAKLTGINRNALSQCEQERTKLSVNDKRKLIAFYEERGYDFNDDVEIDTTDIQERYDLSLNDANKDVQSILPIELSETLATFIDNHHDIVTALLLTNSKQNEQESVIYNDEKAQELNNKLVQHFTDDVAGKVELKSGLIFSESEEDRGMKLVNLLAYLKLKELEQKYPDLVVCSVSKVKPDTDNARILNVIAERLDFKELSEFADYNSELVG